MFEGGLKVTIFYECEVIWTDSAIFKTSKLQEMNSLT